MKKILSTLIVLSFTINKSQTQDLAKLASGENIQFNAFYDKKKENVDGYFTLFDNGKIDENRKKFEYFILDKNLNIVANKEFEVENGKYIQKYVAYTNIRGKLTLAPVLMPIYSYAGLPNKAVTPASKEIDLATNTMVDKNEKCYENQEFIDCPADKTIKTQKDELKKERKEKGFVYQSTVYETKFGNYLVLEYDDYDKFTKNNRLSLFTPEKKELWKYEYNKNGQKKVSEYIKLLDMDENTIIALLTNKDNRDYSFSLLVLDAKNGNIIKQEFLNSYFKDLRADYSSTMRFISNMFTQTGDLDNSKAFDDKFVMVGRLYDVPEVNYENINGQGYIRMIIDKKDYSVKFDMFNYPDQLIKFIPTIRDLGYIDGNYYLDPRDLYFMKNGSVGILTEMYKIGFSAEKTKDFYYIYTDENFKIQNVKKIEKEETKHETTDYLFSQNIKGGDDVVFFYKDLVKDENNKKKINLYINTLIKNQFKQEIIPIATEDNVIIPYVAKEGYILLNEINKKRKYNQIRLEKLNY